MVTGLLSSGTGSVVVLLPLVGNCTMSLLSDSVVLVSVSLSVVGLEYLSVV